MNPAYANPLFAPLAPWLARLPGAPDFSALQALARKCPVDNGLGRPIRFVAPQLDGLPYEMRVWESGEVETRPDHWHDFFNALVWLSFPRSKRAVTAAHVAAMQAPGQARGTVRDALTHFDECGILVLSSDPTLLDCLRRFAWRELFVERRVDVQRDMRFVVFGHAIYESLLAPFRGLTAKAILLPVAAANLDKTPEQFQALADVLLAETLMAGQYVRPRDFQPLPILGIPGVIPENENPAYYDDTWQFRPGRQGRPAAAD